MIRLLALLKPLMWFALLSSLVVFAWLTLVKSVSTKHSILLPVSVLVDKEGSLTYSQVLDEAYQKQFSQPKTSFVGGFTRDVFWFKTTAPRIDGNLWLELTPPYLDYLDIYWQDQYGNEQHLALGDLVAFNKRPIPHRNFIVPIGLDIPSTIYIRLQTHSSSILSIKAWSEKQFQKVTLSEYFLFALIIGGLVSLLIFNLRQALWREDKTYQAYLVYLMVLIITLLSLNGFISQFILPNQPVQASAVTSVILACLFASIVWIYQNFLKIYKKQKPIQFAILMASYLLSFALALGGLAGFYVDLAPLFGIWVIFLYLIWLAGSLKALYKKTDYSIWLVLASISGLVGSLAMIFVVLGIFGLETVGLYAFQIGSLVSVFCFQMTISGQVNQKLIQQRHNEQQIKLAEQKLEQEQRSRILQDQFLSMLTHELKAPLSIIKISLSELEETSPVKRLADQSIDDITLIIERCKIVRSLDQSGLLFKSVDVNVNNLLSDLLNGSSRNPVFKLDFEKNSFYILHADYDMLRIIFLNIIDNAEKYGDGTGLQIKVFIDQNSSQYLKIIFINQEGEAGHPDPQKVFDKYYRAENAYRKTGSGLGLYIVKGLVELTGGQIDYAYQNKKIIFTLAWPAHLSHTEGFKESM